MKIIIILTFALLGNLIIFEIVTMLSQRLYHYIKGIGFDYLKYELSNCRLNTFNSKIINLEGISELNGSYITNTGSSIIFPYYISDKNNNDYGILIFSKEYFLVKNKFKELKKTSTPKHIKF